MNRASFDVYVEKELASTLKQGDIVIFDNLSSHKSERAKAALRKRGTWFLFLPHPIEIVFSKLQAYLHKAKCRPIDDLWKAIGNICDLYSLKECWNYLNAAGYCV